MERRDLRLGVDPLSLEGEVERFAVIRCESVGRRFATATGEVVAVDGASFAVPPGVLMAIAGASGSGKSTLLSIIGCIDRPTSGQVYLRGQNVTGLSRRQRRHLRRTVVTSMLPQPSDNLLHHLDALGNLRWAAHLADDTALDPQARLEHFGIGDCATKRIIEMSGGEQQRLALVCALATRPALVAADEPTSSLDAANAQLVIAAIRAAADEGATIVVATHDPHLIEIADDVVWLSHGKVVAEP